MTQDERWLSKWQEIMDFMKTHERRPSKYADAERGMRNWWKQQQKLVNSGGLKEDRVERFKQLLEMGERYRHKNQYE